MNTDIAAQKAMDRLARDGFDALTETEKTLASAWLFASGVANDGFTGYYSRRHGDLAFHAPTALRTIGAHKLAELAAAANDVFGPTGPPRDKRERRKHVLSLSREARDTLARLGERYYAVEDEEDVDKLLEAYLARTADVGR